jgi:hypothetical protein
MLIKKQSVVNAARGKVDEAVANWKAAKADAMIFEQVLDQMERLALQAASNHAD